MTFNEVQQKKLFMSTEPKVLCQESYLIFMDDFGRLKLLFICTVFCLAAG